MGTEMKNPLFDYSVYERNIFATREEVTLLGKIVADTDASWFKIIVDTIRIIALVGLFWIRWRMFEEEHAVGKQIYERKRSELNEDDLDRDDLDSPVKGP